MIHTENAEIAEENTMEKHIDLGEGTVRGLFGVTPICDRPYDAEPKAVEQFFCNFAREITGNDGAE